ncbi:MAG: cytochrome B [Rhizobiales bacterium PAR1]|nr:MAG: cytochrome B [Rhizobiales bacterium PAR1]
MAGLRPIAYSTTQKALHWIIALMVMILLPVGFYMKDRGLATNFDALTDRLYTAHKTFGALVLLLVILRIVVRVRRGTPAPEPTLNRLQIIAAEAVHGLIYVLLLMVPVLGWFGVSAYGARGILGGFSLPEVLGKDTLLAEIILKYHGVAAIGLLLLIGAHIGAAVLHHFILKDGVVKRMLR